MLAIFAALKEEIKPILAEMEAAETVYLRPAVIMRGEYLGREILISHTGVGVEKMRRAVEFCIREYRPATCINIGYCGALTPNLALADIVIAGEVVDETSGLIYKCNYPITGGKNGTILTVHKSIATPHEKAYLGTKFGAVAVDMESSGLAAAAAAANMPFAVVRSVLDQMDMFLPEFTNVISEDGTASLLNLAANVVKYPKNVLSLPHLQFCAHKARETLMSFIDELIKKEIK